MYLPALLAEFLLLIEEPALPRARPNFFEVGLLCLPPLRSIDSVELRPQVGNQVVLPIRSMSGQFRTQAQFVLWLMSGWI